MRHPAAWLCFGLGVVVGGGVACGEGEPKGSPAWAGEARFTWAQPPEPPAAPADAPPPNSELARWKGTVEAGITGSSGNSEAFNARLGAAAERTGTIWQSKASLVYTRDSAEGEVTKNRFEASLRNDWKFAPDSRWRYFTQAKYEYDDFQDWQHRVSLGAGVGYAFIENDKTKLIGRVGLGVTGELGRAGGDDWTPEGILGADFEHKFTDTQRVFATIDLFPALDDYPEFRMVAKGGYEIVVDPRNHISLRLGAEDRYDSNPGPDTKHNDVDYFAMLAWTF